MLLELRDLFPVGRAGIALRRCSGMQGDGRRALGFGDAAGIGQPKFMSMWSAKPSSAIMRAAA